MCAPKPTALRRISPWKPRSTQIDTTITTTPSAMLQVAIFTKGADIAPFRE